MKKKYKNDLFDDIMEHGIMTTGTVGVIGVVGRMPHTSHSSEIISSMGMLRIPLTTHAIGITFKGLQSLEEIQKRVKKL